VCVCVCFVHTTQERMPALYFVEQVEKREQEEILCGGAKALK